MSRVQDIALGGGLFVLLAALVACAVQMVLEVLAVERDRRKDARRGQSEGETHAAPTMAAPPPGVVAALSALSDDPVDWDEVFAATVKRAHWDICDEWDRP